MMCVLASLSADGNKSSLHVPWLRGCIVSYSSCSMNVASQEMLIVRFVQSAYAPQQVQFLAASKQRILE